MGSRFKTKALVAALAFGFAGSVVADVHLGFGVAPKAKGKVVEDLTFEDTSYLTLWMGQLRRHTLGWYIGGGFSPQGVDRPASFDLHYNYSIINGGTTFGLTEAMVAYAGIGYSIETGDVRRHGQIYRTETQHDLNINAGLVYRFNSAWGGNFGYDSAAEAITLGVMRRM